MEFIKEISSKIERRFRDEKNNEYIAVEAVKRKYDNWVYITRGNNTEKKIVRNNTDIYIYKIIKGDYIIEFKINFKNLSINTLVRKYYIG